LNDSPACFVLCCASILTALEKQAMKIVFVALTTVLLSLFWLAACSSSDSTSVCPDGTQGCPCAENGVCEADLTCENDVCVALPDGDTDKQEDGDSELDSDGDEDMLPDGDLDDELDDEPEDESDQEARPQIDSTLTPDDLVLVEQPEVVMPELPAGVQVRVMSYNIYGLNFASAEEIGAMLAGFSPDLVGLQECPEEAVPLIAQAAGMPYYGGAGVAILSKTPLDDFALVPLLSGRSYAHASTEISGVTFSFYAAHLGWNTDGDKQHREFLDEHLSLDHTKHLVLVGDFNDEHYSSQIRILEELLSDVFTNVGLFPGERISWPSTRFDDTEGSQLIDLIFFRKSFWPIVVNADVINLSPVLSDHKPVIADLLFPINPDEPFAEDPLADLHNPSFGYPQQGALPENLLTNPSAEDGLSGWDAFGDAQSVAVREHQVPFEGAAFFTGWLCNPENGSKLSGASQTVDLSAYAEQIDTGHYRLYASAMMTTGYQEMVSGDIVSNIPRPYDEAEIRIEAIGASDEILATLYSKRRDTLAWHPFKGVLSLPAGTRAARYTWISHHKSYNGESNDAAIDDCYLGIGELSAPNVLRSGNLLTNPGAETGDGSGWEMSGWEVIPDGVIQGLAVFPPMSFSGAALFHGGGALDLSGGQSGASILSQKVSLEAFASQIDSGEFAVRWGGWLRTWVAQTSVSISLEIFDSQGQSWGIIEGPSLFDAEWRFAQALTWLPPGVGSIRLIISGNVEASGTGLLADELFIQLEQRPVR
jgi:endonuclease/exonuclease/phosphatase family metal-dependent hydrolase